MPPLNFPGTIIAEVFRDSAPKHRARLTQGAGPTPAAMRRRDSVWEIGIQTGCIFELAIWCRSPRRTRTQVNPDALSRAAAACLECTFPNRRPLALDGTTRKNSASSIEAQRHLLGVIHHGLMSLVAQADVGEKEIPVAPHVPKAVSLQGTIVSADALHTQVETARQTVEQRGEYLFTVKANQPSAKTHLAVPTPLRTHGNLGSDLSIDHS